LYKTFIRRINMRFVLKTLLILSLFSGTINMDAFSQTTPSPGTTSPAPRTTTPSQTTVAPKVISPPSRTLGEQTVGDYRFRLVASPALGWYEPRNGQLVWVAPVQNTNEHLEVFLTNPIDQKFLPNAGMTLSVYDASNKLVETKPMIMLWSPEGYHYGNNFTVPAAGNYNVRVDMTPPIFARHNKQLGNRFFTSAKVTFQNVALRPEGQFKE
jgi:hypothetical protein